MHEKIKEAQKGRLSHQTHTHTHTTPGECDVTEASGVKSFNNREQRYRAKPQLLRIEVTGSHNAVGTVKWKF